MNNDVKKYIKDCKRVFPFHGKKEKTFLERLNQSVNEYINQNHNVTYDNLTNQFGSPKDIMISYIQDCDNEYIIKKMNIKKLIKRFAITICTILIIGLSMICYLELKSLKEAENLHIVTEETVIEYE